MARSNQETEPGKNASPCLTQKAPYKGLCADSGEKHEPASDIDAAAVDSLKALDPSRPIILSLGQQQTHALQQKQLLFDQFIGKRQQCCRDCQSKRLRGCQIDDQLILGRRLDR